MYNFYDDYKNFRLGIHKSDFTVRTRLYFTG